MNNITDEIMINKKRKNIFTSNLFAMILSVLLAFVIWFYVMSVESSSYTKTFSAIPIIIDDSYMDLSPYIQYDYRVDVTLEGKKSDINNISQDDISAYVDTSKIDSSGRYTLDVIISVPGNINVTEQSLNTIAVFFDNRSSTTVPVVAELISYVLEEGYEIDKTAVELDIDTVEVTGPQSILDTIDRAQANLLLGKVTNSLIVRGTLELIDENGEVITNANVKMNRTEVTATIPVYVYKTIPLRVDYKYGYYNDSNVDVIITPDTIRIKSEASILNQIESHLLLIIDEKNTSDNINTTITLPNNVLNVDNIQQVNIQIKRNNSVDKKIVVTDIKVNNPNNLDYELLEESINVTLRGDMQYMNYITKSEIEAVIDLSYINNATGTTSIVVNIIISDSYKKHVYEIGDYKMSVRIN